MYGLGYTLKAILARSGWLYSRSPKVGSAAVTPILKSTNAGHIHHGAEVAAHGAVRVDADFVFAVFAVHQSALLKTVSTASKTLKIKISRYP